MAVIITEEGQIKCSLLTSLRCVPSVNHQGGTLHVAAHRRGKEYYGVRHLLHQAQTPERCPL